MDELKKSGVRRIYRSVDKQLQNMQGKDRGSNVWLNSNLSNKIELLQIEVFKEAINTVTQLNFQIFPAITLFKKDYTEEFCSIVPRIDWKNDESSDSIIKRYLAETDDYRKVFNPMFEVLFRPVMEEKDFVNKLVRECVLGKCDGLVNIDYRYPQVTYTKVWNHIPGKPITLDYFSEDKL